MTRFYGPDADGPDAHTGLQVGDALMSVEVKGSDQINVRDHDADGHRQVSAITRQSLTDH